MYTYNNIMETMTMMTRVILVKKITAHKVHHLRNPLSFYRISKLLLSVNKPKPQAWQNKSIMCSR